MHQKYKEDLGQDPGGNNEPTVFEAQKEAGVAAANGLMRTEGESAAEVGRDQTTGGSVSHGKGLNFILGVMGSHKGFAQGIM